MANDKPVHEIRIGRIKAVIWGNEIEGGGFRNNVQIRRLYKDYDSFGRDDLPLVAKVADMAHTWIFDRAQDNVSREVRLRFFAAPCEPLVRYEEIAQAEEIHMQDATRPPPARSLSAGFPSRPTGQNAPRILFRSG